MRIFRAIASGWWVRRNHENCAPIARPGKRVDARFRPASLGLKKISGASRRRRLMNTMPPRDPNDDDDEDEEDDKDEEQDDGPAVIREPDNDE